MRQRQMYQEMEGNNESLIFAISRKVRLLEFLRHNLYFIYILAISIAAFVTAALYYYTVLPIEHSEDYQLLIPRFPYSYREVTDRATIYPDFGGYELFTCDELQFSDKQIESNVTLHFSNQHRNFEFSITRGQKIDLSFISPLDGSDLRKIFVIEMGNQFIGDVTGLVCEQDVCRISLSSVEQQKHDVILTSSTNQIDTEMCERLSPHRVQHVFSQANGFDNYYVGRKNGNYIVMTMAREETIWGMEHGNNFQVYRMVKNDIGLSIMTLALCFISIVAVVGGVAHASLLVSDESEN